ncbi:MAG: aldehyde dehydrogenase family protein [Candidatus Promineifilaceae bacterium]
MSDEIEMLSFENPGTGEQFGQIPMASTDEVNTAVEEMRRSFEVWRRISVKERVRILRKLQKLIIDSVDLISETINLDTGKSRQDGMIEVFMMVDRLNQYCRRAPRWLRRRRVSPGLYIFKQCSTEPLPYGVVALISPWNYPFDLMMSPMFSALLAGNTVVLKPSEVAGASGVVVEKLIKQVPELSPFVRVVHGDGRTGATLVAAKPDFVFLTGSTSTGRLVAMEAAENMIPYAFELGGKDPMIVLEDADVDAAARWGTWGAFYNTGQTCQAVERAYVVESVYDDFVSKAIDYTKEFQTGYTADKNNPYNLGPLTFERQKQIIEDHMQDAATKGARVLVGGQIDGLFMQPTLVVDVDHTMKLMQDETFGPIMPIMKVKDEDEAIRMANDSYFGLSASVWSQDTQRARQVAEQLDVGSVNINDTVAHFAVPLLPFGGRKLSGNARIHGEQEILQFTQFRSYSVGRPPLPFDIATVLRQPGHYRLGVGVMHLAFGVTPKQRVQPIAEEIQRYRGKRRVSRSGSLLAAGLMGAIATVFFGLWRQRN